MADLGNEYQPLLNITQTGKYYVTLNGSAQYS